MIWSMHEEKHRPTIHLEKGRKIEKESSTNDLFYVDVMDNFKEIKVSIISIVYNRINLMVNKQFKTL